MDAIEFSHPFCPKHFGEHCCPECEKEVKALVEAAERVLGEASASSEAAAIENLEEALAPFRAEKEKRA